MKFKAIIDASKPWFLTNPAALANLLHPVHRGGKLPVNVSRIALENVRQLAEKLKVEAPTVGELPLFMGFEAPYQRNVKVQGGKEKMSAAQYWKTTNLCQDLQLRCLCCLLRKQVCSVFSAPLNGSQKIRSAYRAVECIRLMPSFW